MPAALSHLKKINKCQLQCKHFPWSEVGISKQGTEGLWGWQGETAQELHLLEDAQGKIIGEFLTEGKDRANPQSSHLKHAHRQTPAAPSQGENLPWVLHSSL